MSNYTLIVGTQNWSSWSLRPALALAACGAPHEIKVIRLRQQGLSTEAILKHSPAGRVPVLQFDGVTVWDSLAICETLAERHPDAGLWPDDARVRAIVRAYAAEMHSGFPDLRDQMPMDFVRRLPLPDLRDNTKRNIARVIEAWEAALAKHGGDFLFGRFSIADCMYAPVVSRFTTYGVTLPQASQKYADRVWALPTMQAWKEASQKEVDRGEG